MKLLAAESHVDRSTDDQDVWRAAIGVPRRLWRNSIPSAL